MSWTGIAVYAALAIGARLGLDIRTAYGFADVGLAALIAPSIALIIALFVPATRASGSHRVPFHHVIGLIWKPGLVVGAALTGLSFSLIFLAMGVLRPVPLPLRSAAALSAILYPSPTLRWM